MPRRFFGGLTLVAILVSGLVLVACGSSDDSTSDTTATALSKADFLQQGNAICAKGQKATDQLANQTFTNGQKPTQAQLQEFTTKATPLVQQQIDGLKALGAPTGDEQTVNQIVTDAQS